MKMQGFESTAVGASPEQIAGAQALLGVRFPPAFLAVLQAYAGSYGDAEFPVPGSTAVASIGHWLSLDPHQRESLWSSLSCWQEHNLPRSVVPIAVDGAGNFLCLDYRVSSSPTVVFWYHKLSGEAGLQNIAPSFEQFMETLREPAT
jgi:hypothetical protein